MLELSHRNSYNFNYEFKNEMKLLGIKKTILKCSFIFVEIDVYEKRW